MKRTLIVALLLVLAGCLGQPTPGDAVTGTTTVDDRPGTTDGPTETTTRTTTSARPALGPGECGFYDRLPRSAERERLPESFDRLPSPPPDLTRKAVRQVAVDYHAVVLDRRLRNRTDIHDYGIGPATTSTAATVTNLTESGACVVVRIPYWLEPDESSVADTSEVATYFVNRTVIAQG